MILPFAARKPIGFKPEAGKTYVLCEGQDEAAVVERISTVNALSYIPFLRSENNNFGDELRQFVKLVPGSRPLALGLVGDKEQAGNYARAEVEKWFSFAELPVPAAAGEVSQVVIGGAVLRIGYFLNPAESSSGALEQLFINQIGEPHRGCIEEFLSCVSTSEFGVSPGEILLDKVRLRAYLAIKNKGGNTSLRTGLQDGHLNILSDKFAGLTQFLRDLSGL